MAFRKMCFQHPIKVAFKANVPHIQDKEQLFLTERRQPLQKLYHESVASGRGPDALFLVID